MQWQEPQLPEDVDLRFEKYVPCNAPVAGRSAYSELSVAPIEGAIMAAPCGAKAPRVDVARDAATGSGALLA